MEAQSACYTLGYNNGGSYVNSYSMSWSENEIPFLMDDVQCQSATTNFLYCSRTEESTDYNYYFYSNGITLYGNLWAYEYENCDHDENVLLSCFESG